MPVPTIAAWFLETLGAWGLTKGLDKLAEGYSDLTGDYTPRDGTLDAALLETYKSGFPNSYRKYGVLFEVVWVQGDDGYEALMVPRGYGQTPSHAIINERTFASEEPNLSADMQHEIADRQLRIDDFAERSNVPVLRHGLWLEYDPARRVWRTDKVRIADAELAADQQMRAATALAKLHATSAGVEKLRLQAVAWQRYYEQYQEQLIKMGIKEEISNLVAANESMTRKIEGAIDEMRRSDASAGFFNFLSLLSAGLNLAKAAMPTSDVAANRYIALRDYHATEVRQIGEKLFRNDLRLRESLRDGPDGPFVVPEWSYKETVEPLLRSK
ncbi:hypothetical protein HFO71_31390 [Rhizobium laguerreae]|uniref:hypothetical protein n=1 Tax=Rhizobium laguerreae TaxID=1076926 RepID=UPI001C928BAE|nr:hypothetical protein [Rhizobium laguerreae]MBY3074816.1 hypothetical protein [Rhizobium laguerreae]MBY3088870.1 hypothetical protein [Rhizobium laguerreae]MBY3129605.1 hypothetical protein [Rhizobium laguerreae]